MNKAMIWVSISLIVLVVVGASIVLLTSRILDEKEIRAALERRVSEQLGLPVTVFGSVSLTLFPRSHLLVTDVRAANAPGFQEPHFLRLNSMEMEADLLPMLLGRIQVTRIVAEGLQLALERDQEGRANWAGVRLPSSKRKSEDRGTEPRRKARQLRPRFYFRPGAMRDVSIAGGSLVWVDRATSSRRELRDLGLRLRVESSREPATLSVAARLNGQPIAIEGTLGSLENAIGGVSFPLDISLRVSDALSATVRGSLTDLLVQPRVNVQCQVATCFPRRLATVLGESFPVPTADPKALDSVSLQARITGTKDELSISEGTLEVDGSRMGFTLKVTRSNRPQVSFSLSAPELDLDRYLPAADKAEKQRPSRGRRGGAKGPSVGEAEVLPLSPETVSLSGQVQAGKFKVRGWSIRDLDIQFAADGGLITFDSVRFHAYEGTVAGSGKMDLRGENPRSEADLRLESTQIGPLLREWARKEFLVGTGKAHLVLQAEGLDLDQIRSSLNGKGEILLTNGALVGADLIAIVRAMGLTREPSRREGEKPITPFSQLSSVFTISEGVWKTQRTVMDSTDLKIVATGEADLRKETLDMRLEPEVGSGAAGNSQEAALVVPVWVRGTFSSPKFQPDLAGIHKKGEGKLHLQIPSTRDLKDLFKDLRRRR